MKNFCLILSLAVSLTAIAQQDTGSVFMFSYFNNNGEDGLHLAYSRDGFKWTALNGDTAILKPTVAEDRLMRDPCIIKGKDGVFHMVWTVSWNDKGIGYASSKDLINWSEQQFIPVMKNEDSARNCWAPEITFDGKSGQYMIYWATTIAGKYKTDDKVESGYNHRLYYTTTSDFRSFSKTALLYDKGFNVIDATILPDGGKYIMFLKDETKEPAQKNIRVAVSDQLTSGYSDPSPAITGKYWAEGPTTLKIGKTWIVYFDKYTEQKYGAVASDDLKNWKEVSDKISLPKGIRHGSIFKITAKEFDKLKAWR